MIDTSKYFRVVRSVSPLPGDPSSFNGAAPCRGFQAIPRLQREALHSVRHELL